MSRAPLAPEDAWLYAASWGSYMTSGDPGACMYGFNERFHVQSEAHRRTCIDYLASCRAIVAESPEHYDADELGQLDALEAAIISAPMEGRANV